MDEALKLGEVLWQRRRKTKLDEKLNASQSRLGNDRKGKLMMRARQAKTISSTVTNGLPRD